MIKSDEKIQDNNSENSKKDTVQGSVTIGGSEYIREKVKQRPLNKKKLLRRTVLTVCMAVIFGVVACVTLLFLEPIINDIMTPEEKPQVVTFPEETEEKTPEEMYYDNEELEKSERQEAALEVVKQVAEMVNNESEERDYLLDYSVTHEVLQDVADQIKKSMVKVTVSQEDSGTFEDPYESIDETEGLIIAHNGLEYLILTNYNIVKDADKILVSLLDGTMCEAYLKEKDSNTGLCVISINANKLKQSVAEAIVIASLGRSTAESLIGTPVFAFGNPAGVNDSIMNGVITSVNNSVYTTDSFYKTMTTDIYGSKEAFGFLSDIGGNILGVINADFAPDSCKNLITALGISELRSTIERMSNEKPETYLGISGLNITPELIESIVSDESNQVKETIGKISRGVFVADVVMDSPAMNAGIQKGDIITKIESREVDNLKTYVDILENLAPEFQTTIEVQRLGAEGYTSIVYDIEVGEKK